MDVKEVRCPYISFSFLFFRFMFFAVPVILFFHCPSFLFIFDFPELHSYFRSSAFLFFQSFICLFFRVSFLFFYNVSFSFLAVFAPFFLFWSVFFFLYAEPFFILKLSVLYFQECPSVVELWQEYCFHLFLVEKLDVYIRWKEAAHWRSKTFVKFTGKRPWRSHFFNSVADQRVAPYQKDNSRTFIFDLFKILQTFKENLFQRMPPSECFYRCQHWAPSIR